MSGRRSVISSALLLGFGCAALGACAGDECDTDSRGDDVDPPAALGESLLAIKGPFEPDRQRVPG